MARAVGRPTTEVLADADEALSAPAPVVGGVAAGVVLDPEARRRLKDGALSSISAHPWRCWLLGWATGWGDPGWTAIIGGVLEGLFAGREPLYHEVASLVLDVEGASPETLAQQIVDATN